MIYHVAASINDFAFYQIALTVITQDSVP